MTTSLTPRVRSCGSLLFSARQERNKGEIHSPIITSLLNYNMGRGAQIDTTESLYLAILKVTNHNQPSVSRERLSGH